MTNKEALAAIEKEMGCRSEQGENCHTTFCLACPHFVDPEKLYDALGVAARVLRAKLEDTS